MNRLSAQCLMQGFAIYMIAGFLIQVPINEEKVAGYMEWRIKKAHDYQYSVPTSTGIASMASQVCNHRADENLVISARQARDHDELVTYLGEGDEGSPGSALCMFAIAL